MTIPAIAGAMLAASAAAQGGAAPARPTARQIVERIQRHVGVPWRNETVDTFKAGDPMTPVTGVAVTMMATLDVLRRAAAAGCNLVITHEPVFYSHLDGTDELHREKDAVLAAKEAFIAQHGMVLWRFHDHCHMRRPDGIQAGMIRALGWERFVDANDDTLFALPEQTLKALAGSLKAKLSIKALRVVGDPAMKVTRAALCVGAPGFAAHRRQLQRPDVQVLVMGEAPEWETIEYGVDAASLKPPKALIILGHIPSEQAGMEECARWLKGFVTDVPVEFVPTAEPFWLAR